MPRPWICTYPGCLAEYATSGALDRHIAAEHGTDEDDE